MADLQDINKVRANIKRDLVFELGYVTPLLQASPEKANNAASKVSVSIKRVETLFKAFRSVHKKISGKN